MRIGAVVLAIWLVIGLAAAAQRDYFSGSDASCAKVGTVALTTLFFRPNVDFADH